MHESYPKCREDNSHDLFLDGRLCDINQRHIHVVFPTIKQALMSPEKKKRRSRDVPMKLRGDFLLECQAPKTINNLVLHLSRARTLFQQVNKSGNTAL